jgi:hypothetical protein
MAQLNDAHAGKRRLLACLAHAIFLSPPTVSTSLAFTHKANNRQTQVASECAALPWPLPRALPEKHLFAHGHDKFLAYIRIPG